MFLLEISFQSFLNYITSKKDVLLASGLNILGVILVLWIGLKIIKIISNSVSKQLSHTSIDVTLRPFITTLISWTLRLLLFISVAGMLGIQTTSFIAVIGAAGLAVGLALQGTLSNFAGGTLLLIFRPYKVGDLIEVLGQTGHVTEIQIFNTLLLTADNKTIIMPNGVVAGGIIINYSASGKIRIEMEFVLSGNSNLAKAREAFESIMDKHELVLTEPAPAVKINKFEGGDPKLSIMPWVHPDNYWAVYWDVWDAINNTIKSNEDLDFPTPNMEVIVKK